MYAPEDVHVEDLVPVFKSLPGRALGRDRGIVHEHANLPEQTRREPCEVIAVRRTRITSEGAGGRDGTTGSGQS